MKQNTFDIAVIGGGASGTVAALEAKKYANSVCIIEGTDRICKKVLISGDGRCNLTNEDLSLKYYYSDSPSTVKKVLSIFGNIDTVNYFYKLGLLTKSSNDGRIFPVTMHAFSVVDVIRFSLAESKILIKTDFKVAELRKSKEGMYVIESAKGEKILSSRVILATGGLSFPFTGSDGSGMKIVEKLGHSIIKPLPSLVQLKLDFPYLNAISGVRVIARVSIFEEEKYITEKTDEVLFTKYGASGPGVIDISRFASMGLSNRKRVKIIFNFLPQYTEDQIAKIVSDFSKINSERSVELLLSGIIHKKLANVVMKLSGIESTNIEAKQLKKSEIERIVKNITHLEIEIMGTLPISEAQVTAGGIPLAEVKPDTLESMIVKGLYFAGEVLNVDGDSGGYNLQWAWSSGYVAGKSAGKSLKEIQ